MEFSNSELESILFELYNLDATATLIYGELDFNYKVTATDGTHFLLKISGVNTSQKGLSQQQDLLHYLAETSNKHPTPKPIKTTQGALVTTFLDSNQEQREVCLISWIDGRLWNRVNPITVGLRAHLGKVAGSLTNSLKQITFTIAKPNFDWDNAQGLWTKKHLDLWNPEQRKIIGYFISGFEAELTAYKTLRTQLIHNDLNDNNIFVSTDVLNPEVTGIIDFGDAVNTQTINDLAICCSYVMTGFVDPLDAILPVIAGYNKTFKLEERELAHLYNGIGIRLVISATKAALNKLEHPDNDYLQVSDQAVWENLKAWYKVQPDFAHFNFRKACGFYAHPNTRDFINWTKIQRCSFTDLFPTTDYKKAVHLDLSVASTWIGTQAQFNDLALFEFKIDQLQAKYATQIIAGGYLEPRPLYTDSAYDVTGNNGLHSRTVHLGVDFWLPAGTPVHALFKGKVVTAVNDSGNKEYGGLIILEHNIDQQHFYTLHGHLSPKSALKNKPGDTIKQGQLIGKLGAAHENGSWSPHLHFQIMLSMLDYQNDFPGVTYPSQQEVWKDFCPDPNLLFKDAALKPKKSNSKLEILTHRKQYLGKGMSLQYKDPLHIVRGTGVYLIDAMGNKYIDTVNNVAHVGHEHPQVVQTGQAQMATLNTNTRYLHPAINNLAKALVDTLPPSLSVVHFVNSGSEANELALRMVQTVTGSNQMLASQVGYHGNTSGCIAVSSYKFDGKGGGGKSKNTHIFPLPDTFRGKYTQQDAGIKYAQEVDTLIKNLQYKNQTLGGLILEPILSCGGQIPLPDGFLKTVYKAVRDAGGLCISDEVQVGLGRLGSTFWGFEQHGVIPDIITIGKPLGNGHPVAAVVCTQKVAAAFANGMEYFNTFGGNPVSCNIALEVLKTIKKENLQQNALLVGSYLKEELNTLSHKHPIIANVRGEGFFLGFELCGANKRPLAQETAYLANRMKDFGFLMSVDGPDHNVIKIKPPMVFSMENAKLLLTYLTRVLNEDKLTHYE